MFSKKFISAEREYSTFEKHIPAPLFRKTFKLDEISQEAELSICGLGFYRLYINGKELTKGHIAPYISNPDDYLYYDCYKIGEHLKKGENCIGVMLGNGLINSIGGGTWDFDKAVFRSSPKLALTFKCGEIAFEADESFRAAGSPITFDDFRAGEFYDARLEQKGWNDTDFDDSGWKNAIKADTPRGTPSLCNAEPIVITGQLKPVSIQKKKDGFLYDFGVNNAGVCRLKIDGALGREISLEHGEALIDGEFYTDNICFLPKGYVQRINYICKGNDDYTPSFTYFGFRYVLVKGISEDEATEGLLTYLVMSSDLKERGGFSCSDEIANKLQEATRRSTISNFFYFPTDCPHREKNGWTGDASLSVEHTLLNLQAENSYSVWMDNLRKAQGENGIIPGIVPTSGWGYAWGSGPSWDNVITTLPYYIYIYRGDRRILEDNAGAIFRYLHYMSTRRNEKGLYEYGLGDWCPAGRAVDNYKSPVVVTDSIACLDICNKAAFIFDTLSMKPQKMFAEELAGDVRRAIREHLVDLNTMNVLGSCQTSQAMGIFYDVFLPSEKQQAFNMLLKYIELEDYHIDVGILGGRVIFHTLSMFGHSDLAYKMITQKTFPSYGHWLTLGATTLFEDFIPKGEKINSLNHHFWGDISGWFIREIGGILLNPHKNNINEVDIKPNFITALSSAKAHHIAPLGKIEVSWTRRGETVEIDVVIPEGMSGNIIPPAGFKFSDGLCVKAAVTGKYVCDYIL